MTRMSLIVLGFLLLRPALPSQNIEPEPQAMQAVLLEVRGLRHDLQVAAIAARRAQILIYRLQNNARLLRSCRNEPRMRNRRSNKFRTSFDTRPNS